MGEINKTNSYTEFLYHFFKNILIVSLPLLTISALALSSLHSSASTDQIEFSLSVSCTMSSVVNSAHTKEITNGTYHSDVGRTTITTLCNDGNGYTVYATGYGNNEEGNNKLINTANPQYSIDTGLATSGSTSQWAVKLNNLENDPSTTPPIIESAYDDTYGLVPSGWTKVASRPSGTTNMNLGSSFTTTYSIYTSSSQFAGTYRGQVKYALLHPYKNDNVMSLEDSFALHGKEKILMEGATNEYYSMQDMSSDICSSTTLINEASQIQLIDIRDNKLYWVAKLADNHCWMTQNLDFDINTNAALNSNTTDLNVIYDSSIGQYAEYNNGYTTNNDVIYWTPVNTATTRDFQDNGSITDWVNSNSVPYSASKTDSTETGHASLGNWYNWTAAIASNDSSTLTQNTVNDISQNPKNSICPKGWRLPTISDQSGILPGSTNEFARLNVLYDNVLNTPLFFVKAGYVSGNLSSMTSAGIYTSSTAYSLNSAWGGALEGSNFTIDWWQSKYRGRSGGWSIRCVVK